MSGKELEATSSESKDIVWTESAFSGDGHLIYDAPVTSLRWSVSVNRYGHPIAKLFCVASGGGPLVLEQQLSVSESDPDAVILAAAREWAESVIADGSAMRRFLMPLDEVNNG